MIGRTVSHYDILEKLGEGGMGVVYKAKDRKLNRFVALKFLPGETSHFQPDVLRFQQEASILSTLNHPNIATIYEIDEADGKRFIALEYLPGGTVRSTLRTLQATGRSMPIKQVLSYGLQIAGALGYAHQRSIIHRDIKTENLLLSESGGVKVTDFGLAKLRGEPGLTTTGKAPGTAAYMSPEQIRGEDLDHRTDIFSVGVVLYELASGRLPFQGEHDAALTYSIVNTDPVSLRSLRNDVPQGLENLILKCLEKEKEKRYQECAGLITALEQLWGELSDRAVQAVFPKQSPSLLFVGAVAAIVVAAVVFFYLFFLRPASPPPAPSIAVLYAENMTDNPNFDLFAAGLTEEIVSELANVPGLRVLSRNDVQIYRGKTADMSEIGKKLGVAYVLESSVRAEGNLLRINCQAIQTEDRFHFWSKGYTREMKGTFEVQSDIAREIALGLKTKFAQKELEQKLGLPANSLLK